MYYEIYKDGELINTIVGDEEWATAYCKKNGYTYVKKEYPTSDEPDTPTLDERVGTLEESSAEMSETEALTLELAADHEARICMIELGV